MKKVRILDFQEVARGIKLCLDNAKSLIEEAEILHNNKKCRGSFVLAQFAWEELAKIGQIFSLLEPINENDIKKKWKNFRKKFISHHKKLLDSLTDMVISDIEETGGQKIEKIVRGKPVNKKSTEDLPDLFKIKELSLYVGCNFNKRKFISLYPVSEDMSEGIINEVKEGIRRYNLFDNHTIEDIEKGLKLYAGDKYWESRPFEPDSKRIKDKFEEISRCSK